MTEIVTETKPVALGGEGAAIERMPAAEIPVDDQLVGMLVDRARAEGLTLTGEGGLLGQLTSGCWSPLERARSSITGAMTGTMRQGGAAVTPATDTALRGVMRVDVAGLLER